VWPRTSHVTVKFWQERNGLDSDRKALSHQHTPHQRCAYTMNRTTHLLTAAIVNDDHLCARNEVDLSNCESKCTVVLLGAVGQTWSRQLC